MSADHSALIARLAGFAAFLRDGGVFDRKQCADLVDEAAAALAEPCPGPHLVPVDESAEDAWYALAEPVVEPTEEAPTMPERIAQRIEAEFYPVHDGEDYHDGINKGLAFAARIARAHGPATPSPTPPEPTEAPKWVDLIGADPDFTGGLGAEAFLTQQRGEAPTTPTVSLAGGDSVWIGGGGSEALAPVAAPVGPTEAQIALDAILQLHRPFNIYDECDCTDKTTPGHVDIPEIGLTCAFEYEACRHCCTLDTDEQTSDCVCYHEHGKGKPRCATVALTAALEVKP